MKRPRIGWRDVVAAPFIVVGFLLALALLWPVFAFAAWHRRENRRRNTTTRMLLQNGGLQ